jgi:hypothetical protein
MGLGKSLEIIALTVARPRTGLHAAIRVHNEQTHDETNREGDEQGQGQGQGRRCKSCSAVVVPGNYGFCAAHHTPRGAGGEAENATLCAGCEEPWDPHDESMVQVRAGTDLYQYYILSSYKGFR